LPADQRIAFFEGLATASPVGRVGRPEDVASSVLYLASNGFVTGAVLDCSGGLTLATGH
jgi:NAD(P)-dependent dehydrogenase (short-subunit alcohol dehydrogenase family)